ncbi:tetratricopeptide repeat-containing sensor histidine kinase [Marinilabilia rubra]|uniref:Histidine kinase n=1 Tax=Marinilabilia rubra TaxID=2162893 RepID=A0A2U2BBS2_9BACT|nr:tetratricopeptide repeat protein [Marinilabilia rubra]PWE00522.1 histidine kinase [Marinilabilia rubra]
MIRYAGLLLILLTGIISCKGPMAEEESSPGRTGMDISGTDSLVVEQLIERSRSQYGQGGANLDITDSYLAEAEEIASKNDNVRQLARIYNLLGKRHRNRARYGEAMKYHQKALDYATKAGDKNLLANVYLQIGVVYRRIDDNPMALEMHIKALSLAEETKDTLLISSSINSIGNVNYNLDRFATSIEYFKRSLAMSRKSDNKLGLAINHNNLGESLLKLGEVDSALFHFFTSLDYNYQINSKVGQSICFNSIGGAYIEQGRPHKALEYLEKALHLNEDLGDLMQVAISYTKIGETYLDIGEQEQAESYLFKAIDLSKEIGTLFQIEQASRLLSELYENQGTNGKALDYFKMSAAYRDSIINEKNIHHLATQQAIFESERQRARIEELNQQTLKQKSMLDRQRFYLITVLILVVAVSFAIIMVIRQSQLRNRYKNVRHQQRLLRSQMNPHFIFNALSAIQVYILEHDIEKSSRFLTDFARLMRQVLRSSTHDYISLKEEAQILGYYLELQRLRFSESFEYTLHVDESLASDEVMVPPMLTQPFIENAIEHGIKPVDTDGLIEVKFRKDKSQMVVEVTDNGIGINASKKASEKEKGHESMAIKITRERLDMLRRDSGGKTDLVIMDKKQINPFDRGTVVKIVLPVVEMNSAKRKTASRDRKSVVRKKINVMG